MCKFAKLYVCKTDNKCECGVLLNYIELTEELSMYFLSNIQYELFIKFITCNIATIDFHLKLFITILTGP